MNAPLHEPVIATLVDLPPDIAIDEPLEARPVVSSAPFAALPEPERLVAEPLTPEPVAAPAPEPMSLEQRIEALERTIREAKKLEERVAVLEQLPDAAAARPHWTNRFNPFHRVPAPIATGWLLWDLWSELRFVGAMIFDRRFRISWTSGGIIVAALAVAFTLHIWLAPLTLLPLVGSTLVWLLGVVGQLICGGLIYKLLHRETIRYRQFLETR